MNERWLPVVGYEGLYEVSSLGRVKSVARHFERVRLGVHQRVPVPERVRAQTMLTVGYFGLGLSRNGKRETKYVHRLVCEAFHGSAPASHDAAHIDGIRTNNREDNLRWATRKENLADKVVHGTQLRGDQLWFTKIPDATVRQIRADRSKSAYRWAKELGVAVSTVGAIRRGEERVHVEEVA